jgi:rRNA-processing protein FCF1
MKIILDTNFLIDCQRFNIDVLSELAGNELFILRSEMFELRQVAERGSKESRMAKSAIEFAKCLKVLEPARSKVDDSLVGYAKEGYAIATQDRELKKRLKTEGARIVYIRQRKYVIME